MSFFSSDYETARHQFRMAVDNVHGELLTFPVEVAGTSDLTIDVAILGAVDAESAVVLSSGCHGVEGFFGSAVQLAFLKQIEVSSVSLSSRVVLIHAINPFGFATLRRFNEDNVDLNRNFLSSADEYSGFPEGYDKLDGLLNPPSPPSRLEPFRLKAMWNILRWGLPAIKASIAGGQYEFPKGLFFGGKGPCLSTTIVQEHFREWIGAADRIVHIDFHTGLGESATYKLLLQEDSESTVTTWFRQAFDSDAIQAFSMGEGVAYPAKGVLGAWIAHQFPDGAYRYAAAEFGTYGNIRVLGAIRAENRAFCHGQPDSQQQKRAKAELLECFVPADSLWREKVVSSGLDIIKRCLQHV
jgi:hypothetical protein